MGISSKQRPNSSQTYRESDMESKAKSAAHKGIRQRAGKFHDTVLDKFSRRHGIKSQGEIAELFGVSEATVSRQLNQPRKHLTKQFLESILSRFPLIGDQLEIQRAAAHERMLELVDFPNPLTLEEAHVQIANLMKGGAPTFALRVARDFVRETRSTEDRIEILSHAYFIAIRSLFISDALKFVGELRAHAEATKDLAALGHTYTLESRALRESGSVRMDRVKEAQQHALVFLEQAWTHGRTEKAQKHLQHLEAERIVTELTSYDRGLNPSTDLNSLLGRVESLLGQAQGPQSVSLLGLQARILIALHDFGSARDKINEAKEIGRRGIVVSRQNFQALKIRIYIERGEPEKAVRFGDPLSYRVLNGSDRRLFMNLQEDLARARSMILRSNLR